MPYQETQDLPKSVRHVLPEHAQEIYLSAFNKAWKKFSARDNAEETCHRIAWSAVKRVYHKNGQKWVLS